MGVRSSERYHTNPPENVVWIRFAETLRTEWDWSSALGRAKIAYDLSTGV